MEINEEVKKHRLRMQGTDAKHVLRSESTFYIQIIKLTVPLLAHHRSGKLDN